MNLNYVILIALFSGVVYPALGFDSQRDGGTKAAYVGFVNADLGGESVAGLSVGAILTRSENPAGFGCSLGLEFSNKVNSGTVSRSSSGDGSLLFKGPGTVSLRYLGLNGYLGYRVSKFSVNWEPYLGAAPVFLFDQKISAPGDTQGYLNGCDWFRSYDVLALGGIAASVGRAVLDIQFAHGLLHLVSGKIRPDGDWPPIPFTQGNDRSFSVRIAAGVRL